MDVTKEAKGWRKSVLQCKEWNTHVCIIENTSSFYYTATDKPPAPHKDAGKVQNIMANKSVRRYPPTIRTDKIFNGYF